MYNTPLKRTFLYHILALCIGPIIVIAASMLGADIWDSFTHQSSNYGDLLSFGLFLLVATPIIMIIHGIILAVLHRKQTLRWIWLPVTSFIFSLIVFALSIYLNPILSTYSDCELAQEDNPVKCGF